jgi:hypothetical protein
MKQNNCNKTSKTKQKKLLSKMMRKTCLEAKRKMLSEIRRFFLLKQKKWWLGWRGDG